MDKTATTLDLLIQEFEVFNKIEGKSPKTVTKYNFVLGMFLRYLEEQGLSTRLNHLTLRVVREYVVHLQDRDRLSSSVKRGRTGLSPGTVDTHVGS